MTTTRRHLLTVVLGGLLAFLPGLSGCGAGLQSVETGVIDFGRSACAMAEQQPEPGYVYFLCTLVDSAGAASPASPRHFTVRVPEAHAAHFLTTLGRPVLPPAPTSASSDAGRE